MPTSPRSTVIPLRRATRERIAALRQGRTFDETLLQLLDAADPASLVRRAPQGPVARPEPAGRRSPVKQRLLARAARMAWERAVADGVVVREGSRLVIWRPRVVDPEVLDVVVSRHRGLAP